MSEPADPFDPPPASAATRVRFTFGFRLLFAVLRATLADTAARRAYLRVVGLQAAATIAIGLAIAASSGNHRVGGASVRIDDHGIAITSEENAETPAPSEKAEPRRDAKPKREGGAVRAWLATHLGATGAFVAELAGALAVAEWCVLALSREYDDVLGVAAAKLTGVPPEGAPETPRVRVNLKWLWKKVKRKARGVWLLALGGIALWPLLFGERATRELRSALLAAWGAYWLLIFTVAKSEHGWTLESPPAPWFVRLAKRASEHPLLRWWIWPWYARMLEKQTSELASPAAHVEARRAEVMGLALARTLTRLPLVYLVTRPVAPVAATHLALRTHGRGPEPTECAAAEPA